MELFVFTLGNEQPGQGAGRGASFHIPFDIKFAAVARAFEQLARRIPFRAASEVGAAVIESGQAPVGLPFREPGASFRHVERHVRLKLGQDVSRCLSIASSP